jgi:ribonuclease Y
MEVLWLLLTAAAGVGGGYGARYQMTRLTGEKASAEAKKLIEEAKTEQKQILLEAKEEALKVSEASRPDLESRTATRDQRREPRPADLRAR